MFRHTLRRLAAEISSTTSGSSCAPAGAPAAELLPPLQLYRRLLRVHRKVLPRELRVMGDGYVKDEFRRTRSTDNPLHIVGFLGEWKKYLDFHEAQLPASDKGKARGTASESGAELEAEAREEEQWKRVQLGEKLDPGLLEALSADQIGQLYELYSASKEAFSPSSSSESADAPASVDGILDGQVLPDLKMAAEELARRNREGEGR
ncbi:hypothetical protein JCM6882_007433 [Rhodosporidiobolus microsporus]